MTDKRPEPPIWEVVSVWCPPSDSPLLGTRDTEHAGVASHPGTKTRRRFWFRANKQTGNTPTEKETESDPAPS